MSNYKCWMFLFTCANLVTDLSTADCYIFFFFFWRKWKKIHCKEAKAHPHPLLHFHCGTKVSLTELVWLCMVRKTMQASADTHGQDAVVYSHNPWFCNDQWPALGSGFCLGSTNHVLHYSVCWMRPTWCWEDHISTPWDSDDHHDSCAQCHTISLKP